MCVCVCVCVRACVCMYIFMYLCIGARLMGAASGESRDPGSLDPRPPDRYIHVRMHNYERTHNRARTPTHTHTHTHTRTTLLNLAYWTVYMYTLGSAHQYTVNQERSHAHSSRTHAQTRAHARTLARTHSRARVPFWTRNQQPVAPYHLRNH